MRFMRGLWRYGSRLVDRYGALAWLLLVGVFGTIFIARNKAEITAIGPHLRQTDLRWLAVVVVCQVGVETLIAQKFRILLGRLGYTVGRVTIMRSHLYRHVIATVIPFGGPAAIVGFANDLGRAGVALPDALYASMLSSIASEAAFLLVLLPTVAWLLLSSTASVFVVVGSGVLVLMLAATIAAVLFAHWLSLASSPLGRRLPRRVHDVLDQLREHGLRPRDLVAPAAMALGVNLCGMVMMDAALRAVGAHAAISTVIAARVIASVVMLLAPVFQGAGAVEFTAAGVLARGGVPMATALAATVIFRVGQFWLPIALGVLTRLRVGRVEAVPVRRWATNAAVSAGVGLAAALVAEHVAYNRLDWGEAVGPLERADLAGLIAALFVFALGTHRRHARAAEDGREQSVAVGAFSGVAVPPARSAHGQCDVRS